MRETSPQTVGPNRLGATHENFVETGPVRMSSDRSFGLTFALLFTALGLWPLTHGAAPHPLALCGAGLLAVISSTRPVWLSGANRLWAHFGQLLHRITNPLIMGMVFFFAVTPTALIMRLMGKDPLRRKIDHAATSYWIDRNPPGPAPGSMTNQF